MTGLSLPAEVLLLAVDPGGSGLLPHGGRRKLRKAVSAAQAAEGGGTRGAMRAARRELEGARVVEVTGVRRTLRLVDRTASHERFRRLRGCIETGEFPEQRDRDLFVLLAATGVLNARLTTYQRSLAARILRTEVPDWVAPLKGQAEMSEGVRALGALGAFDMAVMVDAGLGMLDSGAGSAGGATDVFDGGHHAG